MTFFLFGRPRAVVVALVIAACAPAYYAAHQVKKARRFEIGSMDTGYLRVSREYRRPAMMDGPIRHEDGTVEVIDFYGRLTERRAEIRLPYHVKRTPVRLFLRCHRFGLKGIVTLTVNGEHIDDFVFVETSYPWAGIRTVVPQRVAERGPLVIELVTKGGDAPPSHLPAELGVGLDWIDVDPMSRGAAIVPTGIMYLGVYAFVLGGFAFAVSIGLGLPRATIVLVVSAVLSLASTTWFPVEATIALSRLWLIFVLAFVVHLALVWLSALPRDEARFVSGLVASAMLFHSLLIFSPNHLPPDVPDHAVQASWLSSVHYTYTSLTDYAQALSRFVTDEAVLMGIGSGGDQVPAQSYGAPYPPFFYMLAYGVSGGVTHLRFVLEFLAVAMAALMLVVVYLVARAIWNNETTARIAAILFALEISVWHHANRGHGPGVFGALFVLVFLGFLVSTKGAFSSRCAVVAFTFLTSMVALCYAASLIQVVLFVPILAALLVLARSNISEGFARQLLVGFAVGIAIAIALFYAPYAVEAVTAEASSEVLLSRATEYDPPATFYFLRNLMRDSVRILANGHALFVLLSFLGLAFLRTSNANPFHKCVLWAGVLTYVAMLVLKDPAFVPRVFLHVKEDLFYAPLACMLVALPATRLWTSDKRRRWLVVAAFAGLGYLSVRDKAWNVDTLHPQPLARFVEPGEGRRV